MILLVARHGETTYNERDLVCGISEAMLTDRGRWQAKLLSEKLKDVKLDRVFVSPLKRAIETADIALDGLGMEYTVESRLVEENFGKNEGVPRLSPCFAHAKRNLGVHQPGGESFIGLCHRVYSLIEETAARYPEETVLWICHGTFARAVRTYFVDMTNDEIFDYIMGNCELARYEL